MNSTLNYVVHINIYYMHVSQFARYNENYAQVRVVRSATNNTLQLTATHRAA